ncbi:hypothetical protein K443DRAFT_126886 [Laccaria amethystina LaAM-08-1]|uniref:SAM-dependent MTase RsmB/NOP-type domain-containing protein n=1 Tax=Laccaria amethystina LaAM-08-1 TaxID=1095629 RepID=A0A0C9XYV3_9AGAR|nr:hypothetical protein K443DRAFT_126886 [Laccaria amethystina LaAM-08-1]
MNFYFEAAKTLDRLDAKKGSIKGVIATLPENNRKRTAALVIETLKFKSVLSDVIHESKLMKEERKLTSMNLALVLVHDLLLSRGIQAGDGPIKQAILRHKTRLHGELQKIKIKRGATSNQDLVQTDQRAVTTANIPRYARVNTSLWSTDEAIKYFVSQGYSFKGFQKDAHIPNLLAFSPNAALQDDPAYNAGKIILQDKASCFPAVVLSPPSEDNGVVIDATAAPGNKTSHLSALMGNKGTLYAFERDRKRFSTLKMMIGKAGCKNVTPVNTDFLTVDPFDLKYVPVTHILLDPSCSGSGIVNRLDHLLDGEPESNRSQNERLDKLAAFQLLMIKHAMRFPNVKRIVYSTCSIHASENEHVVRDALSSDEAKAGSFSIASRNEVLPDWPRRGFAEEMNSTDAASALVRCLPGEDATNGFFVSCFVRDRNITLKRKQDLASEMESNPRKRKKKRRKKSSSMLRC